MSAMTVGQYSRSRTASINGAASSCCFLTSARAAFILPSMFFKGAAFDSTLAAMDCVISAAFVK